ncbi:MAG: TIGR03986 family CRISPR-associated RAMP protein [Bacteroidales bacterium]|jgi:CRISPR-associated protein (TIGR03986 family)
MATIKAPFNFVPLSDKVFFPDWADKISHDIPFEDGVSGTIELTLTAKTPIFVRNGHTQADAGEKNDNYKSFSKAPDNSYFIPATSVKGAIRNVLEIMSFGKMRVDENAKFAQREWSNSKLFPLKGNPNEQKKLCCGWLFEKDGRYEIQKCKSLYRINHLRLDEYFKNSIFKDHFSKTSNFNLNKSTKIGKKEYDPKTACFKYDLLNSRDVGLKTLKNLSFSEDGKFSAKYQENRVRVDKNGEIRGTIVLTGQPDKASWNFPRKMNDGKFYEFVFDQEIVGKPIELSENEFKHYQFIYSDSPDWKFAKERMKSDGMPVFFRENKDGTIKDLGLAFLYKLPYDYSPSEIEQKRYSGDTTKLDLADAIFGYTYGKKALRGRVQFSHCYCENPEEDKAYTLVLNNPKASYYPIYIRQNGSGGRVMSEYETYNDGQLSGWKRYHVRKGIWERCTNDPKIDTTIYPLKANSVFKGKVYFHNLKRVELGALISALTFHNTEDCFHQIGQGKPYGFGKVSLTAKLNADIEINPELLMAEFENLMNDKCVYNWSKDNSIIQLFTLAKEEVTADDVLYKYMKLDIDNPQNNEFILAKGGVNGRGFKEYLQLYTDLKSKRYEPTSLAVKHKEALNAKKKEEEEAERSKAEKIAESEREKPEAAIKAAKEQEEKEKEERNRVPLSEKIDRSNKLPTLFGNLKSWLKYNEMSSKDLEDLKYKVFEIYQSMRRRDKMNWNNIGKWKQLSDLVGEKTCKEWFDEMQNNNL